MVTKKEFLQRESIAYVKLIKLSFQVTPNTITIILISPYFFFTY